MRTMPALKGVSGSRRPVRPDAVYALIGAVAISTGVLIYLLDRSPTSVFFLPALWHGRHVAWFPLGGVLPEFLHVFAFILLTAAVVPGPPRPIAICGVWLAIEALFEIGQHPGLAPAIAAALPGWLEQIPVLDRSASYFLHGTFDWGDLVAIALGVLTAYAVIKRTESWR